MDVNHLTEEAFNTIVDDCSEAMQERVDAGEFGQDEDAVDRAIGAYIISEVIRKGYTLMALCNMLMRYQIRIGKQIAESQRREQMRQLFQMFQGASGNVVFIDEMPSSNPFEP